MDEFLRYLVNIFNDDPNYLQTDVGVYYVYTYEPTFSFTRRTYVAGISQFPKGKEAFLKAVNEHLDPNWFQSWFEETKDTTHVYRLSLEVMLDGISNSDYFGVREMINSMDWWVWDSASDAFILRELKEGM